MNKTKTTHTPGYTVRIVSGEGEGPGTIEDYTGTLTSRAIKARLTRERCHGDRWAYATIETPDREPVGCDPEQIEAIIRAAAIARAEGR